MRKPWEGQSEHIRVCHGNEQAQSETACNNKSLFLRRELSGNDAQVSSHWDPGGRSSHHLECHHLLSEGKGLKGLTQTIKTSADNSLAQLSLMAQPNTQGPDVQSHALPRSQGARSTQRTHA